LLWKIIPIEEPFLSGRNYFGLTDEFRLINDGVAENNGWLIKWDDETGFSKYYSMYSSESQSGYSPFTPGVFFEILVIETPSSSSSSMSSSSSSLSSSSSFSAFWYPEGFLPEGWPPRPTNPDYGNWFSGLTFWFEYFDGAYGGETTGTNGWGGLVPGSDPGNSFYDSLDFFIYNMIAPLFADLDFTVQGELRTAQQPLEWAATTWINIPGEGLSGSNTFQIVVFEDGHIQIGFKTCNSFNFGRVGISPGTALGAGTIDFSSLIGEEAYEWPHYAALYQDFTDATFDLDYTFIVFKPIPDGDGYYVRTVEGSSSSSSSTS